ncbi:MAG: TetR/AcrR family transcriptional regulator [Deltaproteobacteria bacterium]|nr:TetR/AcrR family transcriptional regulator [Deltaproteobacteria bacterium]
MNSRSERKLESRDRILRSAAKLFRKKGIAATGVDQIMGEAGLTAGGFYSHFKSKEELVALTLSSVLNGNRENLESAFTLEHYLSASHRDQPENGCVLAALASELPKQSHRTRGLLVRHLEERIFDLEKRGLRRDQAIRAISTAIGSLILSRIVKGTPLSDEILSAGKSAPIK